MGAGYAQQAAGISPEVIAMAVAVTIIAIAGTDPIKKVTGQEGLPHGGTRPGTRRQTARRRPRTATPSTNGSAICASAADRLESSMASPGKGAQHTQGRGTCSTLLEHEMITARWLPSKSRPPPRHAERGKKHIRLRKAQSRSQAHHWRKSKKTAHPARVQTATPIQGRASSQPAPR